MASWRRDKTQGESPALFSMCWVILVSACFGVVLEGPMGAVVFWTLLGLANAALPVEDSPASESADQDAFPGDRHLRSEVHAPQVSGAA
jgi:hypothetical protein